MPDYIVLDRESPVTLPGGLSVALDLHELENRAPEYAKLRAKQDVSFIRDENAEGATKFVLPRAINLYCGVAFSCDRDLTLDFGDRVALADQPSLGLKVRREIERKREMKARGVQPLTFTPGEGTKGAKLARKRAKAPKAKL